MTDPYASIADIYDAEFDSADADIAAYARRGLAGPVAVLGCGTGRVCRGLEGLRPVIGLDRSAPMLERARAHRRAGSSRYVEGDLCTFSPSDLGPVSEVLIPNGSFAFLPDRRAQLACLQACARALPPGAPLTIDVPFPDFGLLAVAHTPERPAWSGVVGGRPVSRTREVFRSPARQELRLLDRYFDGDRLLAESELRLSLLFPRELEWMCEAAGFYVDALWGDHRDGPVRDGCDRLIAYAIRT